MEWFRQHIVGVFVHYINIIFMFALMAICYQIEDFNYLYITLIYLLFIIFYLFYTGVLNTGFKKFVFLLIALATLVFFSFIFKDSILDFFYEEIVLNITSINSQLYNGELTYFYQYKPIITLALPLILIILFTLYNSKITEGILFLSLLEMAFFWYLEYEEGVVRLLLPFAIISVMTYMLNNYKKTMMQFHKKGIYASISGRKIFANILIFSIIAGLISLPLPQDFEGKDKLSIFESLNGKGKKSFGKTTIELATKEAFHLSQTGYSNTEKMLGGPIKLNNALAFKVRSDKSYYLKGSVKDQYTGYSWRNTVEDLKSFKSGISPEAERVWRNYATVDLFPASSLKEITIYPVSLKTSSFMVPMYTNNINNYEEDIIVGEDRAIFMWKSIIEKEYTVEFYDVDYSDQGVDSYGVYHLQNENYNKYLQLPPGVTERTVDLVYDLVKDATTTGEKVEIIRDYLSDNYTYTLDASVLPEGKDFVDYFLFEDPKGYCVHFATALTVMYRIAGIPARYVEGYKMNDASMKEGLYNVTNDTAHAWVEYLVRDNIWAISDCAPTAFEENLRLEEEKKEEEEKPSAEPKEEKKEEKESPSTSKGNNNKEEKNNPIKLKLSSKHLYIALTAIVLMAILIWITLAARRKRKILNSESLIPLYSYILKRLKRYKIKKDPSVTEREFAESQDGQLKEILLPLTEEVYDEFYGGVKKKGFEKNTIYYNFEEYLKKKENKFKYYLKKWF